MKEAAGLVALDAGSWGDAGHMSSFLQAEGTSALLTPRGPDDRDRPLWDAECSPSGCYYAVPTISREAVRLRCALRRLLDRLERGTALSGSLAAWVHVVQAERKRRSDAFVDAMADQMRAAKRSRICIEGRIWRQVPARHALTSWRNEVRQMRARRSWMLTADRFLSTSSGDLILWISMHAWHGFVGCSASTPCADIGVRPPSHTDAPPLSGNLAPTGTALPAIAKPMTWEAVEPSPPSCSRGGPADVVIMTAEDEASGEAALLSMPGLLQMPPPGAPELAAMTPPSSRLSVPDLWSEVYQPPSPQADSISDIGDSLRERFTAARLRAEAAVAAYTQTTASAAAVAAEASSRLAPEPPLPEAAAVAAVVAAPTAAAAPGEGGGSSASRDDVVPLVKTASAPTIPSPMMMTPPPPAGHNASPSSPGQPPAPRAHLASDGGGQRAPRRARDAERSGSRSPPRLLQASASRGTGGSVRLAAVAAQATRQAAASGASSPSVVGPLRGSWVAAAPMLAPLAASLVAAASPPSPSSPPPTVQQRGSFRTRSLSASCGGSIRGGATAIQRASGERRPDGTMTARSPTRARSPGDSQPHSPRSPTAAHWEDPPGRGCAMGGTGDAMVPPPTRGPERFFYETRRYTGCARFGGPTTRDFQLTLGPNSAPLGRREQGQPAAPTRNRRAGVRACSAGRDAPGAAARS